ncbi:uncharacterized protein LACBIDRAFT_317090 [Laccaria bicolor S238N-H82]|uniref:Predicted protein n=1 Tax=Laccaria bicolor (strain S238N-H82 / ATCC MYA-4686) TaxID=486041 RepID=B0D4D7_LACBS|nr:uncharacterized protein LACBIDRAFT_317090 [Laccaria bicolor S238N-H82]EDR10322.1 predicted protein [Laccaria bicolor S238N-H82]|eukprot:XP_001878772.1 predicted protein [Laccaria bicolor S238N-H82]
MLSKANYIPSGRIPLAHCFSISDNLQSKLNIYHHTLCLPFSGVALFLFIP